MFNHPANSSSLIFKGHLFCLSCIAWKIREMTVSNRHLAPAGNYSDHYFDGEVDHTLSPHRLTHHSDQNDSLHISADLPDSTTATDSVSNDSEPANQETDSELHEQIVDDDNSSSHFVRRSERTSKKTRFFGINDL